MIGVFKKLLLKFIKNGVSEDLPDREAGQVIIQNTLTLVSAILLAPFPVVFWYLNMPEGQYLVLFCLLPIIGPIILNYLHFHLLARYVGAVIGINSFILGGIFFGFDAGFGYGVLALLVLPILYLKEVKDRIICYSIIFVELALIYLLVGQSIPWFYEPADKFTLNSFLFMGSTGLLIAYFISSDWVNRDYEKKNIELVRKLTVRNEELKNFSYSTSHDLKQPLRTILNFVSLFKNKKANRLDEEEKVFLKFIEESGLRLNALIDALLEHSVLGQSEKVETFQSESLIQEVIEDLHYMITENEATVEISNMPSIKANRQEIGAVFQNLISNAIKFRRPKHPPIIKVSATTKSSHWQFKVEDNGSGIDEQVKDKIFLIFQRGHTNNQIQGTGIGLANCRKIIKMHSGEIWAENNSTSGSTFYFTIKR